jgi:hypothetical protein
LSAELVDRSHVLAEGTLIEPIQAPVEKYPKVRLRMSRPASALAAVVADGVRNRRSAAPAMDPARATSARARKSSSKAVSDWALPSNRYQNRAQAAI